MTEKKYGYNLLIGEYEKCDNIAFGYGVNTLKALAYLNIDASREVRLPLRRDLRSCGFARGLLWG